VPPMSAELWERVSVGTGKPAATCYRRTKTLVDKFPEPRRVVQIAKAKAVLPAHKVVALPSNILKLREKERGSKKEKEKEEEDLYLIFRSCRYSSQAFHN
jgi:hypothetical protein